MVLEDYFEFVMARLCKLARKILCYVAVGHSLKCPCLRDPLACRGCGAPPTTLPVVNYHGMILEYKYNTSFLFSLSTLHNYYYWGFIGGGGKNCPGKKKKSFRKWSQCLYVV